MAKRKIAFGPSSVSFEWEKVMRNPIADLDFIKHQIDSWIFEIDEGGETIEKNQIAKFLSIMREYGHVSRLNEDYKEKYKRILKFVKENWETVAFSFRMGI